MQQLIALLKAVILRQKVMVNFVIMDAKTCHEILTEKKVAEKKMMTVMKTVFQMDVHTVQDT